MTAEDLTGDLIVDQFPEEEEVNHDDDDEHAQVNPPWLTNEIALTILEQWAMENERNIPQDIVLGGEETRGLYERGRKHRATELALANAPAGATLEGVFETEEEAKEALAKLEETDKAKRTRDELNASDERGGKRVRGA